MTDILKVGGGWIRTPSPRAVAEMRNVLACFLNLERSDIEAQGYRISDRQWADLQNNPLRTFLKMTEQGQQAVTFAIQAKLPEHLE